MNQESRPFVRVTEFEDGEVKREEFHDFTRLWENTMWKTYKWQNGSSEDTHTHTSLIEGEKTRYKITLFYGVNVFATITIEEVK